MRDIRSDASFVLLKVKRPIYLLLIVMFFSASASALELGDSIPQVTAPDHSGAAFKLSEYAKAGYALVFFFPKAETPGCTAQACSLRDAFEEIKEVGARVVGVSSDGVAFQKKFHENRKLPYPLIADSDKSVIEAFGVPTTFGFASRQAFLFKDGLLVWKDTSAATKKQAEEVLAVIRGREG